MVFSGCIITALVIFMNNNLQPSNQDILDAIAEFADHTEERFSKLEKDFGIMKTDFGVMKIDFGVMKSSMVTKDYLDEKLADLRGDLVVLTRKEDTKLKALIKILKNKKIITSSDEKQLLIMEPFAELMI